MKLSMEIKDNEKENNRRKSDGRYCIIATVCNRVEELELIEKLKKEDMYIKEKYCDRFPNNILYLNELPTDVYYQIRLKDANFTIARC